MRGLLAALGGAVCLFAASSSALAADPPLTVPIASCAAHSSPAATVTAGLPSTYPGSDAAGTMRMFLGIPYALPPTGANRWSPPVTTPGKLCWDGDKITNTFGKLCAQGPTLQPWHSEDCLVLNVFTRPTGNVSGQPVMVFIHGGGLQNGSGSFQLNPYPLIQQGVVVVTINYRLGPLGFLAHSALKHKTGNFGILDQQAALKWVKSNIRAFGGDPANVTIFGGSAGGLSVLVHLVSPLSDGLFHKAIIQSGSFYHQAASLSSAQQKGANFASLLGCGTAACLRAKPLANIVSAHASNPNTLGQSVNLLTQDNTNLTDTLQNLLQTGNFKKVPTIVGSTQHETRFHIAGNQAFGTGGGCNFVSNIDASNYGTKIQSTGNGAFAGQIQGAYPAFSVRSANEMLAQQWTDSHYACRTLRVNRWMALKAGKNYAYEFSDANAPPTMWPQFKLSDGSKFSFGAYHGGEQPFLFRMGSMNACGGNPPPDNKIPALSTAQRQLSAAMVTYWTTFAKTGNPNPVGSELPVWPEFQATTAGKIISFAGRVPKLITASKFDTDHKCTSFWDGKVP